MICALHDAVLVSLGLPHPSVALYSASADGPVPPGLVLGPVGQSFSMGLFHMGPPAGPRHPMSTL